MLGGIKTWMGLDEAHLQPMRATVASVPGTRLPRLEPGPTLAEPPPTRWPPARLAAVETLWGAGFLSPGGAQETLRLAKPLGLSARNTVLIMGGGLGGPAYTLAQVFGAWVASFDSDPSVVALAQLRQAARHAEAAANHTGAHAARGHDPSQEHVTIAQWDRAKPALRRRSADHAIAIEALRGEAPGPLLECLAGALRPSGQIVLTELVVDMVPADSDREFAAWCRLENRAPLLPTQNQITDGLGRLGYDVRVVEDLSDRHVTQTLEGWRLATRAMAAGPKPGVAAAAAFVTEAELWLLRVRLMRRLGFRLMRWHAIGTA